MFLDIFTKLCEEKGLSVSKAAENCGISRSTASKWKQKGLVPSMDTLKKISDYFDVSVDYLLYGEEKNKADLEKPAVEDLHEYIKSIKERQEVRKLILHTKDATEEEIEQAIAVIDALRAQKKKKIDIRR